MLSDLSECTSQIIFFLQRNAYHSNNTLYLQTLRLVVYLFNRNVVQCNEGCHRTKMMETTLVSGSIITEHFPQSSDRTCIFFRRYIGENFGII